MFYIGYTLIFILSGVLILVIDCFTLTKTTVCQRLRTKIRASQDLGAFSSEENYLYSSGALDIEKVYQARGR